jgi:O-antigen ligase
MGFLQIGPLTKFVYEETLTFRGYYWNAGIKIFLDNPILGVGFDSYRDFYRRYRNPDALGSLAATDIADSAHNNFIDTAVNGGLALLITYLLIIFYVFRCAIKLIKEMHDFDATKVAVIAAWFAFITQTFVSLPQPGLTLWGWVLSGLVIAIYKQKNYEKSEQYWKNNSSPNYMLILFLFLIGLIITIPPFRASAEYRNAVETQNISTLIRAANMFPQDATMLAAAGGALIGLEQFVEARKILNISIEKFPQYYESWYIYSLF